MGGLPRGRERWDIGSEACLMRKFAVCVWRFEAEQMANSWADGVFVQREYVEMVNDCWGK